jgi:hypothetical protein
MHLHQEKRKELLARRRKEAEKENKEGKIKRITLAEARRRGERIKPILFFISLFSAPMRLSNKFVACCFKNQKPKPF